VNILHYRHGGSTTWLLYRKPGLHDGFNDSVVTNLQRWGYGSSHINGRWKQYSIEHLFQNPSLARSGSIGH
jgi:hypothetical protein